MADRKDSINKMVDEAATDPQPDVSFVVNTEALERITSEEPLNPESAERRDGKRL